MWANKKHNKGFTIVETLIVLAISSALFISTAALIQGQLRRNQARDAAYRDQALVQGVINDVGNGYYPENGKTYNCSGAQVGAGSNRGTNTGCVLVGKRITFQGNQMITDTLVVNASTASIGSNPSIFTAIDGLQQVQTLPWGGSVIGPTRTYYVLSTAFDATFSGNTFVSGAQKVAFYAENSASSFSVPTISNNYVCFDNGQYHAKLSFPTDGKVAVDMTIDDKVACP